MTTLAEVLSVLMVAMLAVVGFVVGVLAVVVILAVVYGWIIMIIQGAVVSVFGLGIATWSLKQSILAGIVLSIISNVLNRSRS